MRWKISLPDLCRLVENGEVSILNESKSGCVKGIPFRLDTPNAYPGQQVHVHIGDYAWNQDGTRSHKSHWPSKPPTNRMKQVAAQQLGIDVALLEHYIESGCELYSEEDLDVNTQILMESMGFLRMNDL